MDTKVKVYATMTLDSSVYSREFELPERPLVGDEITVWTPDRQKGLIVTVVKRRWTSDDEVLDLVCSCIDAHAFPITGDKLKEFGWKE